MAEEEFKARYEQIEREKDEMLDLITSREHQGLSENLRNYLRSFGFMKYFCEKGILLADFGEFTEADNSFISGRRQVHLIGCTSTIKSGSQELVSLAVNQYNEYLDQVKRSLVHKMGEMSRN